MYRDEYVVYFHNFHVTAVSTVRDRPVSRSVRRGAALRLRITRDHYCDTTTLTY